MISRDVEISIAGGVVAMIRVLSLGEFFILFIYLYHVLLVKVQELACIVRYGVKKTLIPNTRPLHLLMGKIKQPESIGKIPLA